MTKETLNQSPRHIYYLCFPAQELWFIRRLCCVVQQSSIDYTEGSLMNVRIWIIFQSQSSMHIVNLVSQICCFCCLKCKLGRRAFCAIGAWKVTQMQKLKRFVFAPIEWATGFNQAAASSCLPGDDCRNNKSQLLWKRTFPIELPYTLIFRIRDATRQQQ